MAVSTMHKNKLYIHQEDGNIVEIGELREYLCPGLIRVSSYVKYGLHGSQRKVEYIVGKDYKYIGKL